MIHSPALYEDNYREIIPYMDYKTRSHARAVSVFWNQSVSKKELGFLTTADHRLVQTFLRDNVSFMPEFNGFKKNGYRVHLVPEFENQSFTVEFKSIQNCILTGEPVYPPIRIKLHKDRLYELLKIAQFHYGSISKFQYTDVKEQDKTAFLDKLPSQQLNCQTINSLSLMRDDLLSLRLNVARESHKRNRVNDVLNSKVLRVVSQPFSRFNSDEQRLEFVECFRAMPRTRQRHGGDLKPLTPLEHQSIDDLQALKGFIAKCSKDIATEVMLNEIYDAMKRLSRQDSENVPLNLKKGFG